MLNEEFTAEIHNNIYRRNPSRRPLIHNQRITVSVDITDVTEFSVLGKQVNRLLL